MDADELSGKFFEFRTDLDRSLRYYAAMRVRCAIWAFAVQALCILTSATFFAAAVCGLLAAAGGVPRLRGGQATSVRR